MNLLMRLIIRVPQCVWDSNGQSFNRGLQRRLRVSRKSPFESNDLIMQRTALIRKFKIQYRIYSKPWKFQIWNLTSSGSLTNKKIPVLSEVKAGCYSESQSMLFYNLIFIWILNRKVLFWVSNTYKPEITTDDFWRPSNSKVLSQRLKKKV